MIKSVRGDMFASEFDIRVNTVNCIGVMGAGVALAFKKRYPEMFIEYKAACDANEIRPGQLHVWRKVNGEWLINFPTKRHWRGKSRYEDIAAGLIALKSYLGNLGHVKVALPALGCGNGGLDWNIVLPMIKRELGDLDAEIHVFEPASSIQIGRSASQSDTDHSFLELGDYGFLSADLNTGNINRRQPKRFYIRGNWNPFSCRWIALLPSKELSKREVDALESIAKQLNSEAIAPAVVLLYKVRASLQVVEIFSRRGIKVVLVLPFGPLGNSKLIREIDELDLDTISVITFAEPKQNWSNYLGLAANDFIHEFSSGAILSDPSLDSVNEVSIAKWKYDPFVFVRYREYSNDALEVLEEYGIRPIGRRPDTGELNLTPLLAVENIHDVGEMLATDACESESLHFYATAFQLRKVGDALDLLATESGQKIAVAFETESLLLRQAILRIMDDGDV